jgi:molecular chaperone HtpG
VIHVDPDKLFLGFSYLTSDEESQVAKFLELAAAILEPFKCVAEIRRFSPAALPALYLTDQDATFLRSVETSREMGGCGLWSSVLDELTEGMERLARLCFNYNNEVIYKISKSSDETLVSHAITMLYVQSVLLSHRPLKANEMAVLNKSLLGLIDWGVDAFGDLVQ